MPWIYSTLLVLAALAALPMVIFKSLRDPDLRRHLGERLGGTPRFSPGSAAPLWIHAVSVGEVQVARRILEEIEKRSPDVPILLTSTTPAGRRLALRGLGKNSRASYPPLDFPSTVRRTLRRTRPRGLILVETELWPNLLRECSRAGVPVVLANGRISARSFPRYRSIRRLMAPALGHIQLFCMQSREDAERIRLLGAPAERIEVTGNVKWDFPAPEPGDVELRREFGLPVAVPVLIAGSTSEGEDEVVVEAWSEVRREFSELRLVLAPRHPHRFEEVARLLKSRDLSFTRRSARPPDASPLLLLDTVGELRKVYAAGTLCFVGGSLVPRGGQNLMEPAAAGRPVLFGPRTENFEEAARLLLEVGGGFRVTDGPSLAATVGRLLRDPAGRERAGERARDLVNRNRGAASRTAERIDEVLSGRKP